MVKLSVAWLLNRIESFPSHSFVRDINCRKHPHQTLWVLFSGSLSRLQQGLGSWHGPQRKQELWYHHGLRWQRRHPTSIFSFSFSTAAWPYRHQCGFRLQHKNRYLNGPQWCHRHHSSHKQGAASQGTDWFAQSGVWYGRIASSSTFWEPTYLFIFI